MTRKLRTVKKTYNLPPDLVARVQKILRARTETDAIIRALQAIADDDEIYRAVKRAGGSLPDFRAPW